MSPSEFDQVVEDAIRAIDPRFRHRLDNVTFVVEPEPPRPGLLGLYQGTPLPRRTHADSFRMPDHITIFQGPHERMALNRAHLEQIVRETVWHEIAHYFGMDEAQVLRAERRHARQRSFRRPRVGSH